jgi:hypothetical protein
MMLAVYSVEIEGLCFNEGKKDISDVVDGLVGHYTVIWVATSHGLGGSVGVVLSLLWRRVV